MFNKNHIFFVVIHVLMSPLASYGETIVNKENKMSNPVGGVLYGKPYFSVRVESENAACLVILNGVEILVHNSYENNSLELPVNQWLRNGGNELSLVILNWQGYTIPKNAKAHVSLLVKPNNKNVSSEVISVISFSEIDFDDKKLGAGKSTPQGTYDSRNGFALSNFGDVIIGELKYSSDLDGSKTFLQDMNLSIPFPEWAFFNSDILFSAEQISKMSDKEYEKYRNDIYQGYRQIMDALEKKDIDFVVSLFAERNKEYDSAFYRESGRTESELRDDLTKIVSRPNTEQLKPPAVGLNVFAYRNNRIVKLSGDQDYEAITFNLNDIDSSESYEIILRRQNGKWIITR